MLAAAFLLGACGGGNGFYRGETFQSDSKYQHVYQATPAQVCEAARQVMLGQGYMLRPQAGDSQELVAVKEFRADDDRYNVLELHATCLAAAKGAILYLTAIEARIDTRQSKSSTSIGVPFTPLSIASSSRAETQVKAVGETVDDWRFYERFHDAVSKQLRALRQ